VTGAAMHGNAEPGRRNEEIQMESNFVMKKILYFSLKMLPRYEGRRTVMQHGAKSAANPAINAAIRDVPIRGSMFLIACEC